VSEAGTTATPAAPDSGVIPGLVWAFRIHADGRAEPLDVDAPLDRSRDGWLWLHFNLADARACRWLTTADCPAPALALLLSSDNYQQLHADDSCVYGVFADLVRDFDRPTGDIGHLRFVMTDRMLISGRRRALHAVEAVRQAVEAGRRLPSAAALLEAIVEHVAEAIDRMADQFEVELDHIEERLLVDDIDDHRRRVGQLRRIAVRLHRQLAGLRTLFHRLEREEGDGLHGPLRDCAGKLAQRLDGLDHDIIGIRERAHLLQEECATRLAEETTRHLHVLSIVTTLLLPPTLVTGLFGMNVRGLPFTETDQGFLGALVIAAAACLGAYWYMRHRGIIGRRGGKAGGDRRGSR
jgi:zinc transporter